MIGLDASRDNCPVVDGQVGQKEVEVNNLSHFLSFQNDSCYGLVICH